MDTIPQTQPHTIESLGEQLETLTSALTLIDNEAVLPIPAKLTIQVGRDEHFLVDAIARTLGSATGTTMEMGSGHYQHRAEIVMRDLDITVYCAMPEPKQAKYERLQREMAALEADIAAEQARHSGAP